MARLIKTVEYECFACEGAGCNECDDGLATADLPAKYIVCDRCEGKGSHTNPNIDGNGITSEEWYGPDWDDESREMYMTGGYDVTCEDCHGQRVVLDVDVPALAPDVMTIYRASARLARERADDDAQDARTRRMESGCY